MNSNLFNSESILLRAFEQSDVEHLHRIINHVDLTGKRYIPWRFSADVPLSTEQVGEIIQQWNEEKSGFHLAIISTTNHKIIGHTSASWGWDPHSPDVSVVIDPPHQRQGLGSGAIKLVINYLIKNTPAHNISTWVAEWNHAGHRFATKIGFQDAGRMRRAGVYNGQSYDVILMDILRPEWIRKHGVDEYGA